MAIKGKNIIVTGGAGFIGSNLVDALAKDNAVTVIDSLHTGSEENLAQAKSTGSVTFVRDDAKNIQKQKGDADFIFHLGIYSASPMYRENPVLMAEVVQGITSVLEYAKANGSKVVFASTSSIYNGVKSPHREDVVPAVTDYYTEARIAAERISELYSKMHGIDVAAMRFFSVYGYHERAKGKYANLASQFLWAMKKGEQPVIYGDGTQKRDFVFAADVANALMLAAERNSGFDVYNVGTGRNCDLNTLVGKINAMLGTGIEPRHVEMPVKNYVMETLADTTKAKSKLGFEARTGLDEGLRLMDSYYK